MGDVVPFRGGPRRAPPRGMCQHGFHKWEIVQDKQFDVRRGRLVTVYRCSRCQAEKVKAL